jgi:hypothetical protein
MGTGADPDGGWFKSSDGGHDGDPPGWDDPAGDRSVRKRDGVSGDSTCANDV